MLMLTLTRRLRPVPATPNHSISSHMDEVMLADGQVLAVPRANLAAAKALLAAQKAAVRRVRGSGGEPEMPYVYRSDTTGWDSGVLPIEPRAEQTAPWLRAEEMRAEKVS